MDFQTKFVYNTMGRIWLEFSQHTFFGPNKLIGGPVLQGTFNVGK